MSLSRQIAVDCVAFILVFGHIYCHVFNRDFFPFSNYPMFSALYHKSDGFYILTSYIIYGIVRGSSDETRLAAFNHTRPFENWRLGATLHDLKTINDELFSQAMADVLNRYHKLKNAGVHNGPELIGLRLCQVSWKIDPLAANRHAPDSSKLIGDFFLANEDAKTTSRQLATG